MVRCYRRTRDGCVLRFEREALLYDISNYCYVEGDISQAESEHDKHQTMDVAEEGNVDRVTRVLDLAYSESVEMLYPYAKRRMNVTAIDNELKESDEYVIVLSLPQGFSETTAEYVSRLIHEYMVSRVVSDWLSITKPAAAENWALKVEDAKDKIGRALIYRVRGLRRKMSPF